MATLKEVKKVQPDWFSKENKAFFNDVSYRVLYSKSKKPYLARSTHMWSDMLGEPKRLVWRINRLKDSLEIDELLDEVFESLDDVKQYLKEV